MVIANKRKTVPCVINQSGCIKPGETVANGSRGLGASFKYGYRNVGTKQKDVNVKN